jgi:effector-binding domain-containing protein
MNYEVRIERVEPRRLAVARGSTTRAELGAAIIQLLDQVWPVLREQQVQTGHNVVVYRGGLRQIEAGVEVFGTFHETEAVHASSTPGGEVVTTAHWGEYSGLANAYAALARWCADNDRRTTGVSWEVYGDWHADPRQVRTDIFFLCGA